MLLKNINTMIAIAKIKSKKKKNSLVVENCLRYEDL